LLARRRSSENTLDCTRIQTNNFGGTKIYFFQMILEELEICFCQITTHKETPYLLS
jgi:hypothetical protein